MTIPDELTGILSINPQIMGGEICFTGTRIPVYIMLDNLQAGVPLSEFMEDYPDLTKDQIQMVIDWEAKTAREALGMEYAL